MALETANTIYAQLGGAKFSMLTGAHSFGGGENSLTFRLKSNPKRVSHVRITLDVSDTYTMTFFRIGTKASAYKILATISDVYNEMLLDVFEEHTGLYATLRARRA